MNKTKLMTVAFCSIVVALTIIRLLINNTTMVSIIVRIMWSMCGVLATILGVIHLVKKKNTDK